MLRQSAPPGDDWNPGVRAWFETVVHTIQQNLIELERSGGVTWRDYINVAPGLYQASVIDLAWRGAKAHTPQRPSPLRRMPQPRMVLLTGATIQDKIAFDTNSGPLSLRRKARCAPLTDQSGQDLDHARRADTTIDIDRQSLGELVGYRQTFELLTIGAAGRTRMVLARNQADHDSVRNLAG